MIWTFRNIKQRISPIELFSRILTLQFYFVSLISRATWLFRTTLCYFEAIHSVKHLQNFDVCFFLVHNLYKYNIITCMFQYIHFGFQLTQTTKKALRSSYFAFYVHVRNCGYLFWYDNSTILKTLRAWRLNNSKADGTPLNSLKEVFIHVLKLQRVLVLARTKIKRMLKSFLYRGLFWMYYIWMLA